MGELAQTAGFSHALALMPARAREDFEYWRAIIEPLLTNPPRNLRKALEEIEARLGVPYKTSEKRYYKALKGGLLAMVDTRKCGPKLWRRKKARVAVTECEGLVSLWRRLCEESTRSLETAYLRLVTMFETRDPEITVIPEFRDWPGGPALPPGLSLGNLRRLAPSKFELTVARRERSAANGLRPTVRTSRVGLYPGSHYMFDDKWHDYFVNSFVDGTGRPLELYSLDYFSALKLEWGLRVRIKDDKGRWQRITGAMTRYVIATTFFKRGYSPRGTTGVFEKNTANCPDKVAEILHDASGGLITFQTSGVQNEAAHAGQYPVIRSGNPRIKAALESNNNLEHNRLDFLPGQTGRNRETRPAELQGRLDYNETLLRVRERLPDD
jgi:hypothetical protein